MKVLILGAGQVGRTTAQSLAREPDNAAAQAMLPQVAGHDPAQSAVRTLADEKRINTFMRLDSPGVIALILSTTPEGCRTTGSTACVMFRIAPL